MAGIPGQTGSDRASGHLGFRGAKTPAFTLLEILLVLALIGLLTSALVVSINRGLSLSGQQAVTVEDVFWRAVTESRKQALVRRSEVRLRYDERERQFVASGGGGEKTYPVEQPGEVQVEFLTTTKGGSSILIGGNLVETQALPYVKFYDDGTCTPFRMQVRTGGPARTLSIDPWTCAPVLESETNR
ncbi:MAG TPA: prepilin-type N-terminal cleavage/methylation domain-containing protein [Opitutaceae bacterium]